MTNTLDLHVEYLSVDHLIPYTHNARTHSDDQVAQIAGSMTEFGFVNPILIGDDGGIIAGRWPGNVWHRSGRMTGRETRQQL